MIYEFGPEEEGCGCHQFVVKAKDIPDAAKKFLSWQNKNFKKSERWPEDLVKNEDSWDESDIHFIGF